MLEAMLLDVLAAKDKREKEKAFKALERLGMDRKTAKVLVNEYKKTLDKRKENTNEV